jgi:formylglycine-generating enzyme
MSTAAPKLYHLPSVLPDCWTCAWGEDKYGIWSDVAIFDITQRFRWIEPGAFLMGSTNEFERNDDERQHEVVLTQGYWLADTACTQTLWHAVMGENPSRFAGDERPVERVSWENCRAFFDKINKQMPELNLRFPTEAEWEYACRAGTTTPFSFGDNISSDQVNYDGNYPYAGGSKGKYRNETVPVKSLPPNAWGLYEMHGNVWEWCEDWYGDYQTEKVVNPHGPERGASRVLRGGSWLSLGGHCRSAYRSGDDPGIRDRSLGFRLSRGQVELKRVAELKSAVSKAKRSEA